MADSVSSAGASALQQSTSLAPGLSKNAATTSTDAPSPSTQVAPATLESYFSLSQISIALLFAQALPEGISMKEYCTELHKGIVRNAPEMRTQNLRHVDTCEFWKSQYERIHQENKRLQGRICVLEERQRIYERRASPKLRDLERGPHPRKRPAELEEVEEWLDDEVADPIFSLGEDYLRLSSYTLRIGRKRRDLETVVKDSNIPEHIDTLSQSTRELLQLLETALADCLMPLAHLKYDEEPQTVRLFKQMMHHITLAYCSSFEALNELGRTIPGRKKRFDVVHLLVAFFSKALDHLHTVSRFQADHENQEKCLRNKRARIEETEYAVNKYLSRTIVQISQMDWKIGQLGHTEILEGILCSVLNHTGQLLSHVIFKEHVAASGKRANISTSPATAATKFEFRYVIPILHAVLGGSTRNDLVTRVLGDSRRSDGSAEHPGNLVSKVKRLIQETLVKSALGADFEGLKLPTQPADSEAYSPGVSHRVEQYGPEWFLESVWALVGWELAV